MAVDLKSNTMFSRISVVLMDDALVKLEHGRTDDRVRRFMYDSIESVIIWRKFPWVRIALCATLLALPGAALLFVDEPGLWIFAGFLLATGLGLVLWYLVCRETTIRLIRAGVVHDLTGVFRPGKVRRLRSRLLERIQLAQQSLTIAPVSTAEYAPENAAAEAAIPPPAPPPLPQ